jgi:hypothetical protein
MPDPFDAGRIIENEPSWECLTALQSERVWLRSACYLNRNRGRRTSGRTRERRIARENKRRLGMGRAESSSNGEKEEENEAHGGG